MKKMHFVLLAVTVVMASFSAYSLAAMNQVYKVYYTWYSQYNQKYLEDYRDTSLDHWSLEGYPENMVLKVISDKEDLKSLGEAHQDGKGRIPEDGLKDYVFLYCSFGQAEQPEYRIKVVDIAQRGNTVEVKVSVNSPEKPEEEPSLTGGIYSSVDVVRIDRDMFPSKGRLYFIFKNQDGRYLGEQFSDIY